MTSAILFKYKVHPFTIKINKTIIQLYSIFGSLDTYNHNHFNLDMIKNKVTTWQITHNSWKKYWRTGVSKNVQN